MRSHLDNHSLCFCVRPIKVSEFSVWRCKHIFIPDNSFDNFNYCNKVKYAVIHSPVYYLGIMY